MVVIWVSFFHSFKLKEIAAGLVQETAAGGTVTGKQNANSG